MSSSIAFPTDHLRSRLGALTTEFQKGPEKQRTKVSTYFGNDAFRKVWKMDQVHLYRHLDPGQQAHAPPLAKGAERLGEDLTGFREFLGKLGFRVRGFDLHMAGNGLDHLPMHTDGACSH